MPMDDGHGVWQVPVKYVNGMVLIQCPRSPHQSGFHPVVCGAYLPQSFFMASNSPRRELGIKQAYKLVDVLCSLTYLIASTSIYARLLISMTRGISKDFRRRELGKRIQEWVVRGLDTLWKFLISIRRRYRYSKNLNPCRFWFQVPHQDITEAFKIQESQGVLWIVVTPLLERRRRWTRGWCTVTPSTVFLAMHPVSDMGKWLHHPFDNG